MLIKDKDILVEDNNKSDVDKKIDKERIKEYKAHMHEAWGDAFDYYLVGITSKYLQFRGRASRLELWGFMVASSIVLLCLYPLGVYIDVPLFSYYYLLATLIPTLAVMSRRIHDINRNAKWHLGLAVVLSVVAFFVGFYVGILAVCWWGYLAILFTKESDLSDSIYGQPGDEDEIYGLDNMKIINKFRFLSIAFIVIAFGFTSLNLNIWANVAEQKGFREDINERITSLGVEKGLTLEEIDLAQKNMASTLNKMTGKEVTEDDIARLIEETIAKVKPVVNDNNLEISQ